MLSKNEIRAKMLKERSELESAQKTLWDKEINKQLESICETDEAIKIHTFLSMGDEVDIFPAIQIWLQTDHIKVYTSESLKGGQLRHWELESLDKLQDGIFGTKFPTDSMEYNGLYDVIIVPGLAFTKVGARIGYGAGYYDRFLRSQTKARKVAICYPFQMTQILPQDEFDIPVDYIILPKNK